MICMIPLGKLQAWFVIIIIAREFIISGFRLVAADNGIVIAASYWGKFKTVSQMFMIIVLIADLGGAFDIVGTVLDLAFTDPDSCITDRLYCKECAGADTWRYVERSYVNWKTGKKIRSGYYLERFLHGCG